LTGGDRVKARFMRQDFFEFIPYFKLIVAGNHKPSLRTVDEAIRRRLHLVPFSVTIPVVERDPGLKDKLQDEWPAILDWMVEGCLDWQEEGLSPPSAVVAASEAYLVEEDTLGRWITERCDLDANAWTSSEELFRDFDEYARAGNEHVGTSKEFGTKLAQHEGIAAKRTGSSRGYRGLKLKPKSTRKPALEILERSRAEIHAMHASRK
jgi:putative DNA primase/helicase